MMRPSAGTGSWKRLPPRRKRSDEACKEARSRLAWLGISLPQRGVDSLVETFLRLAKLLASREIALPPLSVTSALPSLLNGGKDFSAWTKKDDVLYRTLRLPVEAAVGRDSVGLADCRPSRRASLSRGRISLPGCLP